MKRILSGAMVAGVLFLPLRADERMFTYSYEPKVLPKDALEMEQWATLRRGAPGMEFDRWDLRTEFEVGLTDRLTTALYLNTVSVVADDPSGTTETSSFDGLSSEWKYKIRDASADPVGLLIYGEVRYSGVEMELEEKLVAGKNIGDWILAANLAVEEEWVWTADDVERETAIVPSLGAAFRVSPSATLGMEAVRFAEFEGAFDEAAEATAYLGPVVHYGTEKWYVTMTGLGRVAETPDDAGERMQLRLILGIHF